MKHHPAASHGWGTRTARHGSHSAVLLSIEQGFQRLATASQASISTPVVPLLNPSGLAAVFAWPAKH